MLSKFEYSEIRELARNVILPLSPCLFLNINLSALDIHNINQLTFPPNSTGGIGYKILCNSLYLNNADVLNNFALKSDIIKSIFFIRKTMYL